MDWQTVLWILLGCFVSFVAFAGLAGAFLYWRYRGSQERRLIGRIGKISFRDKLSLARDVFRDERIGIAPRLIVFGVLLYVAMPLDIIPDFIPVLGQLDDLVILGIAAWVLVRSIPPEVIEEHLKRYEFIEGEARPAEKKLPRPTTRP
jgi:uncharacterized membrane protein YkvA (DUF1232 family)